MLLVNLLQLLHFTDMIHFVSGASFFLSVFLLNIGILGKFCSIGIMGNPTGSPADACIHDGSLMHVSMMDVSIMEVLPSVTE